MELQGQDRLRPGWGNELRMRRRKFLGLQEAQGRGSGLGLRQGRSNACQGPKQEQPNTVLAVNHAATRSLT